MVRCVSRLQPCRPSAIAFEAVSCGLAADPATARLFIALPAPIPPFQQRARGQAWQSGRPCAQHKHPFQRAVLAGANRAYQHHSVQVHMRVQLCDHRQRAHYPGHTARDPAPLGCGAQLRIVCCEHTPPCQQPIAQQKHRTAHAQPVRQRGRAAQQLRHTGQADANNGKAMVDATTVRAHQHGAAAKGGLNNRPWAQPGLTGPPGSMPWWVLY